MGQRCAESFYICVNRWTHNIRENDGEDTQVSNLINSGEKRGKHTKHFHPVRKDQAD